MKLFRTAASLRSQPADLLLLILILLPFPSSSIASEKNVLIGVLAKRGGEHTLQKWQPTADYLSREISGYQFSIIPLSFEGITPAVASGEIDFILANPSFYVELEAGYGVNRIATLRNRVGERSTTQFGGVIFTRADRDDINVLKDLKGRSLIAVKESSLGGFHMAWGELLQNDIDPYMDLSSLEFGGTHDAVVYAVLKGEVDVGTVRTDTLERMAQEDKIDLENLKVINHDQPDEKGDSHFLHSTQLYPEWPFASLASTPSSLSQTVAVALLRMPSEGEAAVAAKSAGWGAPLNYQPVHDLLKRLKVGIYQDFGKITLLDVLRQYWHWLMLGLLILISTLVVLSYVAKLNRGLTKSRLELKEARDSLEIRVQERTLELEQSNIELNDLLTEHRETLLHLQRTSRDKLLLLDSAGEGIYGMDSDGKVIFANAFTINRLGWAEDELIGQSIHDLAHHTHANGEPYPVEECPSHATLVNGSSHNISDEILWCKDGSSFPVEYTSRPIMEDGEQKGAVVVFRDITQRRQTEAALRRTQKMDALGKLTGGIAHDFNNMLGVILGFSKLLLRQVGHEPKLTMYAQQISHAGERCKMLTTKLLSFSQQEELSAESTDINQLIEETQHILEKTLTARIELGLELAEDLWPVLIDKSSLEDAILNMSINAMHAIEDHGSLKLATRNISSGDDGLQQLGLSAGDYVQLSLIDSGIGMDQETQQHIFDPFFSTKGDQGTGLGMSQVYGFVQRSGGDIHIDSEVGRGTHIAIYFPRYNQTTNLDTAEKSVDLEDGPLGHETILVVDDEAAIRQLSEEILTSYGYRVLCAENGEEALDILDNEWVDLLLSDVIMHGMDGYQLARKVAKSYPQIKIQMMSGFSDKRHVEKDEVLHERQLRKPVASEVLLRRIRELLDEDKEISELDLLQPIEWSEAISTGIELIDADHKMLVALLNRCIAVTNTSTQVDEIGAILEELLEFIAYHFSREEVIMGVCEYPDLERHKREHNRLSDSVHRLINEFSHRGLTTMALLKFLRGWLTNHIIGKDKEIGPYCQRKDRELEKALNDAGLTRE